MNLIKDIFINLIKKYIYIINNVILFKMKFCAIDVQWNNTKNFYLYTYIYLIYNIIACFGNNMTALLFILKFYYY